MSEADSVRRGNLAAESSAPPEGERFEMLAASALFAVERIVSSASSRPVEYLQSHDEWVVLLRGRARLEVAGQRVELEAFDWVWLPADTPHTVLETSADALWLAVHGGAPRPDASPGSD